jgi:hypothetical protein
MYLPSFPRYALTPESTLTPAPVNTAVCPNERNEAMRWTASADDTPWVLRRADFERIEGGMFGTERRIYLTLSEVQSGHSKLLLMRRAAEPVGGMPFFWADTRLTNLKPPTSHYCSARLVSKPDILFLTRRHLSQRTRHSGNIHCASGFDCSHQLNSNVYFTPPLLDSS